MWPSQARRMRRTNFWEFIGMIACVVTGLGLIVNSAGIPKNSPQAPEVRDVIAGIGFIVTGLAFWGATGALFDELNMDNDILSLSNRVQDVFNLVDEMRLGKKGGG